MTRFRLLPIAAAAAALTASPAQACRSSEFSLALIHSELPKRLPPDVVALEVEFPAEVTSASFRREGATVRIIRRVQGRVSGSTIRVSPEDAGSSCSHTFTNGRRGLMVGRLISADGVVTLDPIWVSRRRGFRMAEH